MDVACSVPKNNVRLMVSLSLDMEANVDDGAIVFKNGRWNKFHKKLHILKKIPRRVVSSGSGSVFVLLLLPVLLVVISIDQFVTNCMFGTFIATNASYEVSQLNLVVLALFTSELNVLVTVDIRRRSRCFVSCDVIEVVEAVIK